MEKKVWVLNLAMFLIGLIFVIESLRLGLGGVHRPGSGFLPFYTGAGLSLVAAFSLFKNFLATKREKDRNREKKFFGPSVINVVTIVVVLVAYVLILPWLGYLLSTFMLLIFLFRAGGFRKWALTLAAAFLTTSISYLLFGHWLGIRFPKGFVGL